MNCRICNDYVEVVKEGNGDYEYRCDCCGYSEVIVDEKAQEGGNRQ